eukprot:3275948-Pleurochrysis_carterae.AAC.1
MPNCRLNSRQVPKNGPARGRPHFEFARVWKLVCAGNGGARAPLSSVRRRRCARPRRWPRRRAESACSQRADAQKGRGTEGGGVDANS